MRYCFVAWLNRTCQCHFIHILNIYKTQKMRLHHLLLEYGAFLTSTFSCTRRFYINLLLRLSNKEKCGDVSLIQNNAFTYTRMKRAVAMLWHEAPLQAQSVSKGCSSFSFQEYSGTFKTPHNCWRETQLYASHPSNFYAPTALLSQLSFMVPIKLLDFYECFLGGMNIITLLDLFITS